MVNKEQWKSLTEEQRNILNEVGINSPQDINDAIWKRFEKETPYERHNSVTIENAQELEYIYLALYELGIENPKDLEEALSNSEHRVNNLKKKTKDLFSSYYKGELFRIKYDEKWKKLYGSFLQSNEWKNFRKEYLKKHPKCNRCPKQSDTPHHTPHMIESAIQEGFLKCLKDDNRFEPLCKECHVKEEGIELK